MGHLILKCAILDTVLLLSKSLYGNAFMVQTTFEMTYFYINADISTFIRCSVQK